MGDRPGVDYFQIVRLRKQTVDDGTFAQDQVVVYVDEGFVALAERILRKGGELSRADGGDGEFGDVMGHELHGLHPTAFLDRPDGHVRSACLVHVDAREFGPFIEQLQGFLVGVLRNLLRFEHFHNLDRGMLPGQVIGEALLPQTVVDLVETVQEYGDLTLASRQMRHDLPAFLAFKIIVRPGVADTVARLVGDRVEVVDAFQNRSLHPVEIIDHGFQDAAAEPGEGLGRRLSDLDSRVADGEFGEGEVERFDFLHKKPLLGNAYPARLGG